MKYSHDQNMFFIYSCFRFLPFLSARWDTVFDSVVESSRSLCTFLPLDLNETYLTNGLVDGKIGFHIFVRLMMVVVVVVSWLTFEPEEKEVVTLADL